MSRSVIVGYDVSPHSLDAVRWSVTEARRLGAPLHIVHAFEWPFYASPYATIPVAPPGPQLRDEMATAVAAVARDIAASAPDVSVLWSVRDGHPRGVLCELSREAAMIVVGNRGRGGFAGLLLGSVSVAVAAHAHCPVVVVRGSRASGAPVVVGTDGSETADLAVAFAFEEAAAREVPLIAVRGREPIPVPQRSDIRPLAYDADEIETADRYGLNTSLAGWRAKYPAVPVEARLAIDNASGILVEASRQAQLIVVGSRGRGGFAGLLLGSVSQQLIHHSHCPVAVVRELAATDGPPA